MRRPTRRTLRRLLALTLLAGVAGAAWLAPRVARALRRTPVAAEGMPRFAVRRASLSPVVRAAGQVESSHQTLIECEIENLSFSNGGQKLSAGNPTILELIPEGSLVKRGDVLCRLDSSDFEELVRQQEIKLTRSENDHEKAKLDVQTAELSMREYREGTYPQQAQAMEGQVALGRADLQRQTDRVAWAVTMEKNGYMSKGTLATERDRLMRAEVSLQNLLGQSGLMKTYQAPIAIQKLEMQVANAESSLSYEDLRLRRNQSLMEKFRSMVELCTIRAPHDGFVIYAKKGRRATEVELGAVVHQKMDLFYLPDLQQMEVQAVLNETVVDRVRKDMMVRVHVEGLPDVPIDGHVVAIAPVPFVKREFGGVSDVRSYLGRVRLHSAPEGLLPGMSAEVEIQTGREAEALVVPVESVLAEDGRDYCILDQHGALARREVTLGRGTTQLVEVRDGLEEGDVVIRDPSALDDEEREQAVLWSVRAAASIHSEIPTE